MKIIKTYNIVRNLSVNTFILKIVLTTLIFFSFSNFSFAEDNQEMFKTYNKAIKLYKSNQIDTAVVYFLDVLNSNANQSEFINQPLVINIINLYARQLYNQQKYEYLIELIAPNTKFFIKDKELFGLLGAAEIQLKNYSKAEQYSNLAIKENPDNKISDSTLKQLNIIKQNKLNEEIRKKNQDNLNKAESLFRNKKYQEAKKIYHNFLSDTSSSNLYYINKAKERIASINSYEKDKIINGLVDKITSQNLDFNSKFILIKKLLEVNYSDEYKFLLHNTIINHIKTSPKKFKIDNNILTYYFQTIEKLSLNSKINCINDFYNISIKNKNYIIARAILKYFEKDKTISGTIKKLKDKLFDLKYAYWFYLLYLIIIILLIFIIKKLNLKRWRLLLQLKYFNYTGETYKIISVLKELSEIETDNLIYQKELLKIYKESNNKKPFIKLLNTLIEKNQKIGYEELLTAINFLIEKQSYNKAAKLIEVFDNTYPGLQENDKLVKYKFIIYKKTDNFEELNKITSAILNRKFSQDAISSAIELKLRDNEDKKATDLLHQWINHKSSNIEKIKFFLEDIIKKFGYRPRIIRNAAILHKKSGNYQRAIELYEQTLNRQQNKLPAYSALIKLYLQSGNNEKALEMQKLIIDLRPNQINDTIQLAELYYRLDNIEKTAELYVEVLKNDNDNLRAISVLENIARRYYNTGNIDSAIYIYYSIINSTYIDTSESKLELGRLYIEKHEYENAITTLQLIQTGDVNIRFRAMLLIGKALLYSGKYELAIDTFNQVNTNEIGLNLEIKKLIYYSKGLAYEEMEKYKESYNFYKKLILLDINYKDIKTRFENIEKLIDKNE